VSLLPLLGDGLSPAPRSTTPIVKNITAEPKELEALSERLGGSVSSLAASVTVSPVPSKRGRVAIAAVVSAVVGRSCVRTGEAFGELVEGSEGGFLDLDPPEGAQPRRAREGEAEDDEDERIDATGVASGRSLDLGELVVQVVGGMMEPYPKKPGTSKVRVSSEWT
jgi:hypothetical protein